MSDLAEPPPSHCPGVSSEDAGKNSACQGCPNQSICSGNKVDMSDDKQLVCERLKTVRNKIMVLSGKGGVGKSTMTMILARRAASMYPDMNFGILDVDICGPSQPRMMGVEGEQIHHSGSGWSTINVEDNLCVMSIGFLLPNQDSAVIWRGPKKNGMIKQFLTEVDWGNLDCLFLDTPPGTSDEHLSTVTYLQSTGGLYAVVVTTPQQISLLDVRKEISFCRKLNIPIIGVIENMSSFCCPNCKEKYEIFPSKTGGAIGMCKELNLNFIGTLPIYTQLAEICDKGEDMENIPQALKDNIDDLCTKVLKDIL